MIDIPAQLRPIALAWAAFAGAAIGSFLNVVIARVPAGESVVHPRSRCPRCHTPIAWYHNLPVISWIVLRARCRACGAPISVRYPVVELAGGAAAVVAVQRHGFSWAALVEFAFVALLVALSAIDLDTWLLPHALTWPVIGLGLIAAALGVGAAPSFRSAVYGAGIGWASFAIVAVVGEKLLKKEAMGWGDVWLLAGLGAFLGLKALLPVVLLASLQGAVVGLVLIAIGRAQPGPASGAEVDATDVLRQAQHERGDQAQHERGDEAEHERGDQAQHERGDEAQHELREDQDDQGDEAQHERGSSVSPDDEDDWVPPKNAVPFGPFLALGAIEWLWGAGLLARAVPLFDVFR